LQIEARQLELRGMLYWITWNMIETINMNNTMI